LLLIEDVSKIILLLPPYQKILDYIPHILIENTCRLALVLIFLQKFVAVALDGAITSMQDNVVLEYCLAIFAIVNMEKSLCVGINIKAF